MKKRILSVFLVLAMLLSMVPAVAVAQTTVPEITRSNLVLSGVLRINFKVDFKGIDPSGYSMRVTVGDDSVSQDITTYTQADGLYVYTTELGIHRLYETVKAELLDKNGRVVDSVDNWSAETYLNNLQVQHFDDAELLDLTNALRQYGAYAAYYTGKQTNPMTDGGQSITADTLKPYAHEIITYGVNIIAYLYLDGACDLGFKFLAKDMEGKTLYVNGAAVKTTKLNDTQVGYRIAELLPQDWDTMYNVVVKEDDTVIAELNYSVLSYALQMLKKGQEVKPGLNGLLKSMYQYNRAAEAYLKIINAGSFTGNNIIFADYAGQIDGMSFEGVKLTSNTYQPSFTFTSAAVKRIQSYAAENGYDTLNIHAYSILTNNLLVVDGKYTETNTWVEVRADIGSLTTDFTFRSDSEGTTEVYLWFTFSKSPVIHAESFAGDLVFADHTGQVGGQSFTGVKAVSSAYQPKFTFTEAAVKRIRSYAENNGYNTLTVHGYPILTNNGLVVNGAWTAPHQWTSTNLDISGLTTATEFWSQSEGTTEVYLWFEFCTKPVVNAGFFTGSLTFADYEGQMGGQSFTGVKATSSTYQPKFYFTENGVSKIKAYAAANGYDTLTVYSYARLSNNQLLVNGNYTGTNSWSATNITIDGLTTATEFWSQSEGTTEVYLWFTFGTSPVIHAGSFSGGLSFADYSGEVSGEHFTGVKATSSTYQPHFSFTQEAVSSIQSYAAAKGYDTLVIHAYPILMNNGFVIDNNAWLAPYQWATVSLDISTLSAGLDFWSQSEGQTEIYMWFEFAASPVIHAGSFTGGLTFTDHRGEVGGTAFTGVKAAGNAYQPHFTFTQEAVADIQVYAQANGYNTLTVHAYPILSNNGFVVNGTWTEPSQWTRTELDISTLSTATDFWSQGESQTEIYLWFTFGVRTQLDIETTDTDLVKNGQSDYQILIPENTSSQLRFAANELALFFEEATGVRLDVTTAAADLKGKYLSIGETEIQKASGMDLPYSALGSDGYKVLTYGDAIVMAGATDVGSTYAVYGYLAQQLQFEYYAQDVYEILETRNIKLAKLDMTQVPDIPFRSGGSSSTWYSSREHMSRMRLNNMTDGWGLATHTYFQILPPSKYLAEHPDWYNNATAPTELCLTNEEMKTQFIENLKQIILDTPYSTHYMLGHEDGEPKCTCADCKALTNNYKGYYSAVMVLFTNDVVRQINAWAAEAIPERTLQFCTFAYTTTEKPPVETPLFGSTQPINNDQKLMLESNLGIMIAPIGSHVSWAYSEQKAASVFSGWDLLTDNLYVWGYSAPFSNYLVPFDCFDIYSLNYGDYAQMGVQYVLEQGFTGSYSPNFHELRSYLISKLMWDTTLDTEALVQDFMRNYYGPGWEHIYDFYTQWRQRLTQLEDRGYYSYCAAQLVQDWCRASLYSKDLLAQYDACFDAALAENEALQATDAAAYARYRDNIRTERCLVRYLELEIYGGEYDYATYAAMLEEFTDIANRMEFTAIPVGDISLDALLAQWQAELSSKQ